jgi:hypothetical protein
MRKPFSIGLFSFLPAILLLFAVCSAFPSKSGAGEVLALNSQAQERVPETERVETAPAKIKLVHPEVPRIPARDLVQLLKNKADIILVDTQPTDGYEMWRIPSAINIPYVATANPTDRQLMLMAWLPSRVPF